MMVVIDSVAMTVKMVLHGVGMFAIGVIMVVGLCCVVVVIVHVGAVIACGWLAT